MMLMTVLSYETMPMMIMNSLLQYHAHAVYDYLVNAIKPMTIMLSGLPYHAHDA